MTFGKSGIFGGGRASDGGVVLTVAAADAPSKIKARADYVCDGVDDHVQIQAAIDSFPVSGDQIRGAVVLSSGKFVIGDTIKMYRTATGLMMSSITLRGQNCATTQIVLANGVNKSMIEAIVPDGSNAKVYFTGIYDLEVNGNRAKNTSSGTYTESTFGNGILISHSNRGAGTGAIFDFHINRVMAIECVGHGFNLNTSWGGKITDCITELNNKSGLSLGGTQNYVSNHFTAYNREHGIFTTSQQSFFNNIHAFINGQDGIQLGYPARDNTFANIFIKQFGYESQGTPATETDYSRGLLLDTRVRDCQFTNIVIRGQSTTKSLYGIRCSGNRNTFSNINITDTYGAPIYFDPYACDNILNNTFMEKGSLAAAGIHNVLSGIGEVTIADGGTGYTVGDVLTVAGGGLAGKLRVVTAAGGIISAVKFPNMAMADYPPTGSGYTTDANPRATTGGTGSGCTINITALATNMIDTDTLRYVDYN